MEELIELIRSTSDNLNLQSIVFLWLAIKLHQEVFKPLKSLSEELTKQIKAGSLSHTGIEERLDRLSAVILRGQKPSS